jgi:large subunit ribosomal protein L12
MIAKKDILQYNEWRKIKMEYLHASLILHSAGKKVTEKAITDIINAAGLEADKNRIKGLVAALADVNIEEALKSAAVMPAVASAPAAGAAPAKAEAAAAAPEPEEEEEEESGLSSLFG